MYRILFAIFLSLGLSQWGYGQDVETGPPVGKPVPALVVQAKSGSQEGKKLDYAKERKKQDTFYVFIPSDKWSRPMHRFLKGLGPALQKKTDKGRIVAVWLTDNPQKTDEYLPKIASYYQVTDLTYFPGDKTGPMGWGINDQADVTVVIASQGKVAARLGYVSINETVVSDVMKAYSKALKKSP